MLSKQDIVDSFAKHKVSLHPAGIWEFDAAGKKKPVVAFRQDGLPLSSYPDDNMFKLRVDETPYMVIDVDGGDIAELYQYMPSLQKTLTTTTTREDKFHIYIERPEDFPITRIVNALPQIDILSNGIVFEGHLYNINKHYDIENKSKIVSLTPNEIAYLKGLVPSGTKSYTTKVANKRFNPGEKLLVEEYLKGTLKDERKLWKALTPKTEQKQGKSSYSVPPLAYDTFNTMAFYLALNEYIPHASVIGFLEKFLVKEHNINLNSPQTQQRLYKQIIPTLPVYEVDEFNDDFDSHIATAPKSSNGLFKLLATTNYQGELKFVLIDKYSFIPQQMNGNIMRSQKAISYMFPTLDADTWAYGVPRTMVELTSDPFKPQKSYDFTRNVFTLSTIRPSEYLLELGERPTKPDNIITRAIEGIFKLGDAESTVDPEDFYYHWLAHVIFSSKQLLTVMCLATDANAQGGTGKSTLTMRLPMHILPIGTTFKLDNGSEGWGDAFHDSKLTCFDDLHDSKDWNKLYNSIKKVTTGGYTKRNLKGKGVILTNSSPCLSISANFLPRVDETDRRFFIWSPAEKLSDEEGRLLSKITEDFNGYHNEIQEIADYCQYLYVNEKDKYHRELYIEAPVTSYFKLAKTEGATSKKLLSIILNGPDTLFDSFVPNKRLPFTKHELIEFMLKLITDPTTRSNHKYTMNLPQDLCKILLNATRDEDMSNESPRNVGFAIGCTFTPLTKGVTDTYRKNKKCADWTTRGVRLPIEEATIAKYSTWLKYNKPQPKEVFETVDV